MKFEYLVCFIFSENVAVSSLDAACEVSGTWTHYYDTYSDASRGTLASDSFRKPKFSFQSLQSLFHLLRNGLHIVTCS